MVSTQTFLIMRRWPSGLWQWSVKPPGKPIVGSNPTLRTLITFGSRAGRECRGLQIRWSLNGSEFDSHGSLQY